MTLTRRPSGFYGWEARDRRIPKSKAGHQRISISLRTKDRKEAQRRARALDVLLERGEIEVLQRLRAGDVHISELADAVRREAIDEIRGKETLDLSLGAMIDRVLTAKRATRKVGTANAYRTYTNAMLRKWPRSKSITDISSDEMREWLYEKKDHPRRRVPVAPWSANSQAGALMVAGYLWRLAIRLELEHAERLRIKPRIVRNPWKDIEKKGTPHPRAAFLEPQEWATVIEGARGRPEAALLALCCLAGLRIREALYLRTALDIDLDAGTIHVQGRKGEHAWSPKHVRSDRVVPMSASLKAILREHVRHEYAGERYFIRLADHDRPLGYTTAQDWVRRSFERAGLKYGRENDALTCHSLRHSFASILVREGWSSSLVAKLMGNTAKEVDKTYAHLAKDDLVKVIATLDRLMTE